MVRTALLVVPSLAALLGGGLAVSAAPSPARVLRNDRLEARFDARGLAGVRDLASGRSIAFTGDSCAITTGGEVSDTTGLQPAEVRAEREAVTYTFRAAKARLEVRYELRPGWRFVSKQLLLTPEGKAPYRVDAVTVFRARLEDAVADERKLSDGAYGSCLRLASAAGESGSGVGLFFALQNPFNRWQRDGQALSLGYAPEMEWRPEYGPFASDRACIGTYQLSGTSFPARLIPEWKYLPDPAKALAEAPSLDLAETQALTDCVRAFLLVHPRKSTRIHVGWCANDYQIDVATPEGHAEYRRIIERAAELGCREILYTPANSLVSDPKENADGWGWENVLWLGMGQKIRKEEWRARKDVLPPSVREMQAYAKARGIRLVAYVYPSLPFLQNSEWTRWAGDQVGGYHGADTGVRSFQDWLTAQLVSFAKRTGAGGFSFDYWWITFDKATSKYAQWYGCRRVLENLRRALPDIVIDGRQAYHGFGPWIWLAGSYPHPTASDEQPLSFKAFPDLHTDRVSADRERFTSWLYRLERFCPVEITPGFITHQTQRSDAKRVMHRDRFRPRDWDVLGWRYSLLSSLGSAPFNHVVNVMPARDEGEFEAFPEADRRWFRQWLDWSDRNLETLRHLRPILGQPMVGRVDGSAAIRGERGFLFLFNPNYRALPAEFTLDASIGLEQGESFVLRELAPREGVLLGKPGGGFWRRGDRVSLTVDGTTARVLALEPAPRVTQPLLMNVPGKAVLKGDALDVTGVTGQHGTETDLLVALPAGARVRTLHVNGKSVSAAQNGSVVSARVRFAGERFGRNPQVGSYDPAFTGGTFQGEFTLPARLFAQLRARKEAWAVRCSEDDLVAPWMGSDRLLLFVNLAEPVAAMPVSLKIDGAAVPLQKAYNSIYGEAPERTFLGFYADVSTLAPDRRHTVELSLPALQPGQFQGLYFENVEAEETGEIAG